MNVPWYDNALGHYLAGITVSLGDRLFSQNAKRHKEERIKTKIGQVEALEYLANTNETQSPEYLKNMLTARDYFRERGISVKDSGMSKVDKTKDAIEFYRNHERFNKRSWRGNLAAAFGIELVADATVAVAQVTAAVGNGLTALAHTLYQGPALFLGMQTGKGILYAKDFLFKSKEEKELDKIAKELTHDGRILDNVKVYSPTSRLKHVESETRELSAEEKTAYNAENIGRKAGEAVLSAADSAKTIVSSAFDAIRKRAEERRKASEDAEKKRKDNLRSDLDKY